MTTAQYQAVQCGTRSRTGELRATLNGHADYVTSVAFQPPTIEMIAKALADVGLAPKIFIN